MGLSSGLEYEVGSYASTEEVVSMARVAATHGGFYTRTSATRPTSRWKRSARRLRSARSETAGAESRTSSSAPIGVWGKAGESDRDNRCTARKRSINVTANVYPYLAWSSNLKVLVPDKQWTNPSSVKEALDNVGGGRNVQITRLPKYPQFVGKRLDEIALQEGVSEVDM